MKQQIEQGFSGGMKQDLEKSLQSQNTYRYARNGRLLYVHDPSDTTNGRSFAFANVPGNKLIMQLPAGSTILHLEECRLGTVVFSVIGNSSEIGIWHFDEEINGIVTPGIYETKYTDSYDPHLKNKPYVLRGFNLPGQDRLGWKVTDRFDSEVVYENSKTERIYWTTRRGAKHVLNLRDTPVTNPSTGFYPSYWSAHSFRDNPDLVFPLIKLLGRGQGSLPSGSYQVCMRYRSKNGVRSAFSPITRRTFVTTEPMESYNPDGTLNETMSAAYRSNHHNRTMGASGRVTQESLKWELKNIDVRWEQVELAVLYYETEGLPTSTILLNPVDIIGASNSNTSLVIEIKQLDGTEITIADLSQRYEVLTKVGTLCAHQNRLFEGNITRLLPINIDSSKVTFVPTLKSMRADSTFEPTFISKPNAITHRNDNDPLTNTFPSLVENVTRNLYNSVTESFKIDTDYTNDKGQVWEWMHGSYFRGETEEFSAILFDRIGQPMFAYPLPAYTFPEQYAPGPNGEVDYYSLTKQANDGVYDLRIMGVTISGIRIPTESLYDEYGRLNVSGFMIARRKRIPRLLHQGVVFPVCRTDGCTEESGRDHKPFALPHLNYFATGYSYPNQHIYPDRTPCGTAHDGVWNDTYSLPYFLTYNSPDVLIEGSFIVPQSGDVLKHVGIAGQAYASELINLLPQDSAFRARHQYTKSFNTSTQFVRYSELLLNARPGLGDTTRLSLSLLLNQGFGTTYEKFDKDDLLLKFESATHPLWIDLGTPGGYIYGDGLVEPNAVLIKTSDWPASDIAESVSRQASFRLVNFIQAQPERSNESEPYYACGHFQPITDEILQTTTFIYDSIGNRTHFEFNNVEVWGGDAYVNLFDFTRIYPYWSDQCEKHDYSLSHIIPIESKYNLSLRQGRSFARNAVRPEETACNQTDQQFTNGIMHQQPEDWNYNKALLVNTSAVSYGVQPRDYLAITDQPSGFTWTPIKQSGQLIDNWRIRLAGDSGQGEGEMGGITKLIRSETQGLYAWHQHGVELLPLEPFTLQASDAGTILTNSGAVFHRGIPISRKYGTNHPDSVWQYGGQMGAWDARMGVLLRHTNDGMDIVSQSQNMTDLIESLTLPLSAASDESMQNWNGITGIDNENGEIWITLSKKTGQARTLVYSTKIGAFTSEYDCLPALYGNRGRLLLATNPNNQQQVWAQNRGNYGQFFGAYYSTLLHFIVNPFPTQNKTFTNGQINVNREGATRIVRITHYTPEGGVAQRHVLLPQSDDRFSYYQNRLQYPSHALIYDDSLIPPRDHYQTVELEIKNDENSVLVSIVSNRTIFRISE